MTLIFSQNYQQFREFLREHNYRVTVHGGTREDEEFRYVEGLRSIQGRDLSADNVVLYGTPWYREDFRQILDYLRTSGVEIG